MSITKSQKEQIITDLAEKLKKMKSSIFVQFFGLKVKDVEALRKECRKAKVDYVVAKKTLLNIALKKAGIEGVDTKQFDREVATAISYEDEVAGARVLATFARTNNALKFIGGVLEGKLIDGARVKQLASLPTKPELLGQLVGTLQAPISGFVRVLSGNLRGLVQVLSAIQKSKS